MKMITEGKYKARASGEVVLGTSAKKGTPFVELYFEITDGENKGGKVRWTAYFAEKSAERTIEALQIAGWEGEDLSDFSDGGLHGLDKNEVEIAVELEEYEYEGEKRTSPRVQWVNRLGGYLNVQNAMSAEAAESFGEKMKGLVLKVRARKPAQPDPTDFPHGANAPAPSAPSAPSAPGQKATGTGGRRF
jgi:hypothetical protein